MQTSSLKLLPMEAALCPSAVQPDYATPDGKPRQSTGARKDFSSASVTLKIIEAKMGRELWSGTEKVKSALKKKAEEDNVVAAAEKLFLRFHDAVEPPKP